MLLNLIRKSKINSQSQTSSALSSNFNDAYCSFVHTIKFCLNIAHHNKELMSVCVCVHKDKVYKTKKKLELRLL